MRARTAAWGIAAVELAMLVATLVLGFIGRRDLSPSSWGGNGFNNAVLALAPMTAFPLFGGLMASRRPSNPIGWICLGSGAFWFFSFFTGVYATFGLRTHPGALPAPELVGSIGIWVPAVGLLGTFLFLLFPDGHLPSRRWRPVAWLSGALIVVLSVVVAATPGPVQQIKGTHNPLAPHGAGAKIIGDLGVLFPVFLACIIASVVSVVLRYRRAGTDEREKLKWIAFAGVGLVVLYVLAIAGGPAVRAITGAKKTPLVDVITEDFAVIGYALMPVASFFAVLRYRLYDIDRVISRTLSYAVITTVLVAGFALIALVPTAVVGSSHVPSGLIAAATLVLVALFRPLRGRVQRVVDRRFNRAKYDAAQTVEIFAARLRDEIDIDTLKVDLETLVLHTMEPAHVSLWIAR